MNATQKERKARSPYQRKGKVPYRYSDLYYQWRAAIADSKKGDAAEIGRRHWRSVGLLPVQRLSAAAV